MIILLVVLKEITNIFKEMTYNIDVHTSKKISQPLKCRRLKKSISQSLCIISKRKKSLTTAPVVSHSTPKGKEKEKEKDKKKEMEKEKTKDKEKNKEKKVVSCDVKQQEKQQYPFEGFNIDGEAPELMSCFLPWINEGLYKNHAKKRDKDDHYLANCSKLGFKQFNFVVAFPKKKDWFYVMSQPNRCWTGEHVDVILYFLRKKSKQHSHSKYRYTTTNCFFKIYIDNASAVPENEYKIIGTIKGFGIPTKLPWHLTNEVYVPVNCKGKFHWVLAVVVLKERCIKVYDSMSSSRTNRKLSYEIQKLSTMLPKYLESIGFFEQKDRTN
ncbi:hypothetical protein R3W88_033579 [Solanum pinnatisectum]|uniref:Ubiquitin-like protease family profile domain-containing protein n=1 Tax=Solanum pinnatisectum TaxID=50273 RepID=A0AAV9K0V8_9SOLN|nr:hypothetical protein R3W88_033579 [Solanum pinnatisectum]